MLDPLLHFPIIADALGFESTRAVKRLCERHEIPVIKLNKRVNALRASDYELLLQRASQLEPA
jgi:hypothetical protein